MSDYRKGYICYYALLIFVEEWQKALDNQEVPTALLMGGEGLVVKKNLHFSRQW